jgi:hypothetical protein
VGEDVVPQPILCRECLIGDGQPSAEVEQQENTRLRRRTDPP